MTWLQHNRFVVRGTFGTTDEVWSNSLNFTSLVTAGPDTTPGDWTEEDVTSAVDTFYGGSYFGDGMHVTGWRGYHVGSDNNLIGDDMVRVDYDTPVSGAGTTRVPPQVALCMSLRGDSRGLAQNGRIYLPSPALSVVNTTQEISTTNADTVLAAFKTYVEALKDAMYSVLIEDEDLINVSGRGTAVYQRVTEYRCGLALDTLRTRRNKLQENYQVLAA